MNIDKVAILVNKAALEFDKISNPHFAEYDLTASQYRIIKFLYAQPSRTARVVDLERQYSMTHPTTLGLLEALKKKGFTVRIDNPNDGRGKLVALTKKADRMQDELEALGAKIEDKLTERLSANEKGVLVISTITIPDNQLETAGYSLVSMLVLLGYRLHYLRKSDLTSAADRPAPPQRRPPNAAPSAPSPARSAHRSKSSCASRIRRPAGPSRRWAVRRAH